MFCSSCGVALAKGLSYCNYCGAKAYGPGDQALDSPEVRPELLVSAMAGVFILGVGVITLLMGMMKSVLEFNTGQVMAFALLCFLIMLSLEGVFLRLLFRRKPRAEAAGATVLKGQATRELDAAHAGVLPEPVPSVTENTTRALSSALRKGEPKDEG